MEHNLSLDALFYPSSLAVVGASSDENKIGGRFLKCFLSAGFKGRLYPINPRATEIMGLKSYPSILDVPDEIDLALLTIPSAMTEEAMLQCARKRVRFAVVHGTGFSEFGPLGKDLEVRVLQIARQGGVRIVGPNCMGLFSPGARLNTIVARYQLPYEPGAVSVLAQSGWVSENTILMGLHRGLRFSKVVSSGNQSDLDTVAYLEYFGADPRTSVIGAYLEGFKRGREVLALAREITKHKPIILWKSGRTPAGGRAVASHTGSLAGSDQVTDAALRQAGVVRVQHLEELHDLLAAFSCPQLPRGRRVGVLVESGGGGAAAADACEGLGLEIPVIPQAIQDEMKAFVKDMIPPSSGIANPVDLVWAPVQGADRLWAGAIEILAKAVDVVMVLMYYPLSNDKFAEEMAALRDRLGKPLIFLPGHPTTEVEGMAAYVRRGLPTYPTPERAARAIQALYQYASYLGKVRYESPLQVNTG